MEKRFAGHLRLLGNAVDKLEHLVSTKVDIRSEDEEPPHTSCGEKPEAILAEAADRCQSPPHSSSAGGTASEIDPDFFAIRASSLAKVQLVPL
jgi:hypothetical protein